MKHRHLYIAAYDIRHPRRLRKALTVVRGYASGGQKSVYECFLTEQEKQDLLVAIRAVVDVEEDRFFLLRLHRHSEAMTLGRAVPPQDGLFYYLG